MELVQSDLCRKSIVNVIFQAKNVQNLLVSLYLNLRLSCYSFLFLFFQRVYEFDTVEKFVNHSSFRIS